MLIGQAGAAIAAPVIKRLTEAGLEKTEQLSIM
jgi:hypothetical protein